MARAEDIVRWFHGLLRTLLIRATSAFAGGASVSSSRHWTGAQLTTAASVIETVAPPSLDVNLLSHWNGICQGTFDHSPAGRNALVSPWVRA